MSKLLIKKKDGSVHIRTKSEESAENLSIVHENKVKSWLALSEASHSARGGTMEDIIQRVIDECKGAVFKEEKPKVEVTEEEYKALLIQAMKKGVSSARLNSMVKLVAKKEQTEEELKEMVAEFIAAQK